MKGRLSINMLANMASFMISITVSMWLTPFIIHSLGAEAYGFIPLTQQLINYMSIVTIALNGMVARFFTYSVKSGDKDAAERYFNTSLISSLLLSVFISLPLAVITIFVEKIVHVPGYLLLDVRISLAIYGVIFVLTTIGASFSMAMFCQNRLDISGILGSVNTISRSVFIVLLLGMLAPRIWLVSLGSLAAAVILFVQNIYYFKKLMPDIRTNLKKFDLKKLKELLSSGIWSSVNYVGAVLFLQIDMLVANWAMGPSMAGEYSAVLQLSNLLRGFVATIVVVFGPTMVELYAKGEIEGLVRYSNRATKITGIIMALPVGLACSFGGVVLALWLGEEFKSYNLLFFLMTIHLSVNLAVQPLFGIFSAANRVRTPAIVTLTMGLFNFILAVVLSMTFEMGAFGIVIAGMIVLTAKNLVFTPIYSSIITRQPLTAYYKGIFMPVGAVAFVVALGIIIQNAVQIDTLAGLITASAIVTMFYAAMTYFLVLSSQDRQRIKDFISKKRNVCQEGGR